MLSNTFNEESASTRPDLLTEPEFGAAFACVAQDYLAGKTGAEAPHLYYITGLPGAGKSTFVAGLKAQDEAFQNYVHINFDDLRVYHPRYAAHVAADPVNAAARIDFATERLMTRLVEKASNRRLNVLMDDAAMGSEITAAVLKPFADAGYVIDAAIISVPPEVAQQSVMQRFEADIAAAKSGAAVIPRWVNSEEQAKAPQMLQETVETLRMLARKVDVFGRNGEKISAAPSGLFKRHGL